MKKQIQLLGGLMVFIALLTMNSTAFADFVIKGGGTVVVKNGTSLTANTNVKIESGGTLDNSGTVTLNANFSNDGEANLGSGPYVISGSAIQNVGGTTTSVIQDLTVNNTSDGVVLTGHLRVENSLTLNDGVVDMADYSLTLGPSITSVDGTPSVDNMIVTNGSGELRKEFFGSSLPASFDFPLGDNVDTPEFSPLSFDVNGGEFEADDYIGASVKNDKQPNNNSYDNFLNRYWGISADAAITNLDFDVTGTYLQADVVGTEADIREGLFRTPEWFIFDQVDDSNNEITFIDLDEGGDITGVEFLYTAGFKVFLQGAYDYATPANKLMRTELKTFDFIPQTAEEAYAEYSGQEALGSTSEVPLTAVDWVLVELRIADVAGNATAATSVDTVAGFLLEDGTLVSVDGVSDLPFKSAILTGQDAFFVIHHRNHIPVMTAGASSVTESGNFDYDFTTSSSSAFNYGTIPSLVLVYDDPNPVNDDIYGLYAGDGNHDYLITYGDKQPVDDLTNTANDTGYIDADNNMDGLVNYGDKQFIDDNITKALQLPY